MLLIRSRKNKWRARGGSNSRTSASKLRSTRLYLPLLVSRTRRRVIYLALELDRSWTETVGVNPLDGTNYLGTVGSPKIYGARAVQATWKPSLASDGRMSE